MKKETQSTQQAQAKKPYVQPKLVEYGDVRRLTKAGLASGKEGPGVGNETRRL